jgi:hypothetical protein
VSKTLRSCFRAACSFQFLSLLIISINSLIESCGFPLEKSFTAKDSRVS